MSLHQCYRFIELYNWIMEPHQPIIGLLGATIELHKSIIKPHKSCRIVGLHRSCDHHKFFIELHQFIVKIRTSIIKLHNSERIMELHKSVVEIHHWFMDIHTSIIGIQSWLMELHSSLYEGSQLHSWRFIITKTGCQLHWQLARMLFGEHITQLQVNDTEKTQEVATETDHPPFGHGYFDPC